MDEHGYPDDDELKRIEEWDWKDPVGLMDFVYSLWAYKDWGWKREGNYYYISTGGWSGNEDIMAALGRNQFVWMFNWVSSKRGGHYEFELRDFENEKHDTL